MNATFAQFKAEVNATFAQLKEEQATASTQHAMALEALRKRHEEDRKQLMALEAMHKRHEDDRKQLEAQHAMAREERAQRAKAQRVKEFEAQRAKELEAHRVKELEAQRVDTERVKALEAQRVMAAQRAKQLETERVEAERVAERERCVMALQARLAELKSAKQGGLDAQVAPVKEEIKAIETQVEPQGQQWLDTTTAVVVTSPATFAVPAQTVEYTVQVQPPVPALTADGKPADDPGGMPADDPGEVCCNQVPDLELDEALAPMTEPAPMPDFAFLGQGGATRGALVHIDDVLLFARDADGLVHARGVTQVVGPQAR